MAPGPDVAARHLERHHRRYSGTRGTLVRPSDGWMQSGGRDGRHTEHLGHLLAEMQFLQRTYPGATW